MQRSLTILSSVVAPLTLFITSKLVIPNVHERDRVSGYELQGTSPCGFQRTVMHTARCSRLTLGRRARNRNRWKYLILINATKSREKSSLTVQSYRWDFRIAYQLYTRCSDYDFRSRFLFPSRAHFCSFYVYFSGKISWKICRAGFIRCRSSRLMRSWPIVCFWWLLLFCAFCRKAKSVRSHRSTRLVSQNKSGGHVTVRSCDDWYFFWYFAEKQNPRFLSFRSNGSVSLDKNGMVIFVSKGLPFISYSLSE